MRRSPVWAEKCSMLDWRLAASGRRQPVQVREVAVREQSTEPGGMSDAYRLLLEDVCSDLVRFLHSRGDPTRFGGVVIDREWSLGPPGRAVGGIIQRLEEHTSELQSR